MFRRFRWLAVVTILLSTSVAFAQRPQGGQGGRPGGGGFGGGGFGGGGGNSPITLAANEAVQKDLNLTDEQAGAIKTLGDQVREEMRSAFTGGGAGGQNQSEEERAKAREKMAESIKKVNDKFQPKLDGILDAGQRDRLKQIQIQADGSRAYSNADVVAALKISKDQQDKIAAITKDFAAKQGELFPRGGAGGGERPNFEEMQKKMTELNANRDKQLAEVLTADQKSALEKMKGKTFDVAALRPSFGGGGRPGAGGGGANASGRPQRRPGADGKKAHYKKSDKQLDRQSEGRARLPVLLWFVCDCLPIVAQRKLVSSLDWRASSRILRGDS
mgnify:CR=1 FL=1